MLESAFLFVGTPARPSCHCASITELPGAELFATWYAGTHEGNADVVIMAARSRDGVWGEPWVLVDPPGQPAGNTVVYAHGGELWHFYDVIEGRGWDSAILRLMRSPDGGTTWSEPQLVDPEPGMMVRHRPVRLSTGRILLPAYDEKTWRGFPYITDDEGASWRRGGWMAAEEAGAIQPAIIERDDGTLFALLRSGREVEHAWQCTSGDGGESWSACEAAPLHNPNSGADMIRLASGEVITCFNDTPSGRTPLTLAISRDEGRSWGARRNVEDEPGEYSYPTLMAGADGSVHLVYTWRRERIRWVRFEAGWVEGG